MFTRLEQYNTDHAVLGYFLVNSWGLDRDIADVIRDHHNTKDCLTENKGEVSRK